MGHDFGEKRDSACSSATSNTCEPEGAHVCCRPDAVATLEGREPLK
jgi:hypothetical protein